MHPEPLCNKALAGLAKREQVPVPGYDRGRVRVGVVHLGVGGFHRAHQAWYLDRVLNQAAERSTARLARRDLGLDWGICGVGVLPQDRAMRDALAAQDYLFTLVQRHPDGRVEPRVVGAVVEYLLAPDDPMAVVERMVDPAVRVVSLTVTEGGYGTDPSTGRLDLKALDVTADLARGRRGWSDPGGRRVGPRTTFGLVVAALARRRAAGLAPFAVLSCDNVQSNGRVAREAFASFATALDPGLGAWVAKQVRFPCSMVDRITPATTDADREELAERYGIIDRWPVICEPFAQWVVEDWTGEKTAGSGSAGPVRPPLEDVGVQLVADVEPYELMKLRLLNGSHQALCYLGYLAGHRLVHKAAQDPLLADLLLAYMKDEAIPTLHSVPGVDVLSYRRQLLERFGNPQVRDTIARLCADSSHRIPTWLLPVVREQLARGRPVRLTATVVAAWARYAEGVDEQGQPIDVVDPRAKQLTAAARVQRTDPLAFLRQRDLFGDLAEDPRFTTPYAAALRSLHRHGALAAVRAALGRDRRAPAAGHGTASDRRR
jgi:mannitol 2-dehydrogenase